MKIQVSCVLLALLAAPVLSDTIVEPSHKSLHFTMERYPGYFGEYCLDMKGGETWQLTVHSPKPVQLNVHYHAGSQDEYLLDALVDNANPNSVSIPAAGKYCLQVTNVTIQPSRFDLEIDYVVSID